MTKAMLAALSVAILSGPAWAGVLDDVRARGELRCGVSNGVPGFSYRDAGGRWEGFDADFCRALAAAVLGDPEKVAFVPTLGEERFALLADGSVDLLARNTTWTFERDAAMGFDFVGVSYYDGQGFLAPRAAGALTLRQLDGAAICVAPGTTTEANLAERFRLEGLNYTAVPVADNAAAQEAYLAGRCGAYTGDVSALAATRAGFPTPREHLILREVISKEPLGPLVREGDPAWADIVRWTLFALITAEEKGVGQADATARAAAPGPDPEVNRLLGTEGDFGPRIGLSPDWAARAIAAVGNYGELFERTVGENTAVGLSRGLNALYVRGGILYAPPFR